MPPPKNKGGSKKSKEASDDAESSNKQKGAQSINVRHILVCDQVLLYACLAYASFVSAKNIPGKKKH